MAEAGDDNTTTIRIVLPERLMELLEDISENLEVIASKFENWAEDWANPAVTIEEIKESSKPRSQFSY